MRGVAYTVFEGTKPEAMNVEILGVLKNALGPHRDMILARLEGSKPEYTGVVSGMSGSPVYIDGKLLGALAYRIGQFSKEPIAGITPIAEMLDVDRYAAPLARAQVRRNTDFEAGPNPDLVANLRASLGDGSAAPSMGREAALPAIADGSSDIRPIDTPLVFSGFSPDAVKLFGGRFRALGLTPVAGLSGVAPGGSDLSSSAQQQKDPLVPGSAVSALLVTGDLEIAATCTVTYVDPRQVLACGHPITQFGSVSIPMAKTEVVATLASPLNSFKIVNTLETVGAFTEDRASAIRGVLGQSAHMIPVSIHISDGAEKQTLHIQVIDNPDVTPGALMVSLYQSLMQTNNYGVELTYAIRGTVMVDGYPTLHVESLAAPTAQIPSALRAALAVGQRFSEIYGNSARLRNIRAIDLDVNTLPGRRSMELERAQAAGSSARPGDAVVIEATLRPFQGEVKNLRIPIRLPQTLAPGPLRVLVSDGATLDRLTNAYPGVEVPSDLSGIIQQLNSAHADDRLYVTLLLPDAQAVVDGHTLPSIPISMANILEPLRANRVMSLNGESVVPVTSIPVDAMLTGQQIVTLNIEQ